MTTLAFVVFVAALRAGTAEEPVPVIVHIKPHKHHTDFGTTAHFNLAQTRDQLGATPSPESEEEPKPEATDANANDNAKSEGPPPGMQLDLRPIPPNGKATIVKFGMLFKEYYGVDFKHGTVTADLVMTLKWLDDRVATLLSDGQDELTVSQERAPKLMWMPDIGLTNRNLEGVEVISTGVTVFRSGEVMKVQRLLVVVKEHFDIHAFPFDTQFLRFRIASTTLMSDELELAVLPDKGINGIKDGIFDGHDFRFVNTSTRVFKEQDGNLKKSRGELVIEVKRDSTPYIRTLLVPELILVAIAYTVFLFPLAQPFIMPRVATSMITFMSLMVLTLRTSTMLPIRDSNAWIDIFEENAQIMMFLNLSINIFLEAVAHELGQPATAAKMQCELRFGIPAISLTVITICFFRTDGTGLWWLSMSTKAIVLGVAIPYICWCVKKIINGRRAAAEAAAEQKRGP